MIAKWRRNKIKAATDKKAQNGNDAFVTDRDEKGEPKAPEQAEVPRLAAKKDAEAAPVATPPAAVAPAPAAATPAPIPAGGTFDINTLSSEALAKAIKALTSIKEFETDKSAQALIEEMASVLKTRPIEPKEEKAAPAAAAPAPLAAAPVAAPLASKSSGATGSEDPKRSVVPLGGLNVAATEEGERHDDVPVAPTPNVFQGGDNTKAEDSKVAVAPEGWEGTVKEMKKEPDIDNPWALAHWMKGKGYESHKGSTEDWKKAQAAMYRDFTDRLASGNGGSWFVDANDGLRVKEDGGRTPEIAQAHSAQDDKTGISRPATVLPEKLASEMATSKAVKEAEKLGANLKQIYLDAKAITGVNDSRAVREAVESIFRAANMFDEATKVLNKQQQQEQAEEDAAKIKDQNKKKSSALGGLSLAAAE